VSLEVQRLQQRLLSAGFNPGPIDGIMGPRTRAAQRQFESQQSVRATDDFQPARGNQYQARGTGYYPANTRMEGGFKDRLGRPLNTLQDYLAGRAPYVSVAMDRNAFPYGTKLRIPELEAKYGRPIEFRVVDTGGAFRGRGTSRIDICVENRRASLDPTINGPLTLVTQ
jgi:peptidoglycan hydrolase-like protein with peptidoglycan-binding domain